MFYTFISLFIPPFYVFVPLFHVFIHPFYVFIPLLHVFISKKFSPCVIWLLTEPKTDKLIKLTEPINL
ncbi:hypothetical protein Hanom_Chr12g01078081 [Helianthus anomalus]